MAAVVRLLWRTNSKANAKLPRLHSTEDTAAGREDTLLTTHPARTLGCFPEDHQRFALVLSALRSINTSKIRIGQAVTDHPLAHSVQSTSKYKILEVHFYGLRAPVECAVSLQPNHVPKRPYHLTTENLTKGVKVGLFPSCEIRGGTMARGLTGSLRLRRQQTVYCFVGVLYTGYVSLYTGC